MAPRIRANRSGDFIKVRIPRRRKPRFTSLDFERRQGLFAEKGIFPGYLGGAGPCLEGDGGGERRVGRVGGCNLGI